MFHSPSCPSWHAAGQALLLPEAQGAWHECHSSLGAAALRVMSCTPACR